MSIRLEQCACRSSMKIVFVSLLHCGGKKESSSFIHLLSLWTTFIWLTLDDFMFYGILTLGNLMCMHVSSCKFYLSYAILSCTS
ncbi:hypothetical protein P3S68_022778 [Capsicum galapagoense]